MLQPLGVHAPEDIAELLYLDHGEDAASTHPAILFRDACEHCKEPIGGEDGMGLTWRVGSPRGLPWLLIELDYEGETSEFSTCMPISAAKLERDFLDPALHHGEGDGILIDYVMEQLDEEDRAEFWSDLTEDCHTFEKFYLSIDSIKAGCLKHDLLRRSANTGDIEAVNAALDLGGAPNAPDLLSNCALHFAAAKGFTHLIAPLIDAGARVDEIGNLGQTALHMAARGSHAETCLALMAHGADVRALDQLGRTPLQLHAKTVLERGQAREQAPSL